MKCVNFTTSFTMTPHLRTEADTLAALVTVVMFRPLWLMDSGVRVPIPFIFILVRTIRTIVPLIFVGLLTTCGITPVLKAFTTRCMFALKSRISTVCNLVLKHPTFEWESLLAFLTHIRHRISMNM